jgi:hypothetical protein
MPVIRPKAWVLRSLLTDELVSLVCDYGTVPWIHRSHLPEGRLSKVREFGTVVIPTPTAEAMKDCFVEIEVQGALSGCPRITFADRFFHFISFFYPDAETLGLAMDVDGWSLAYELHGDDYTPHEDGRGRIVWTDMYSPEDAEWESFMVDFEAQVTRSDAFCLGNEEEF